MGAALLAHQHEYEIFLSDNQSLSDGYRQELNNYSIPFEEKGHTIEILADCDLIIKSPGVPSSTSVIQDLTDRGIDIVSDIDFASRYTTAKIIAITGSNGKTTTTTLVHHLLQSSDYHVGMAGNVGISWCRQLAKADKDIWVLELSSFQLEDIPNFRPWISAVLNITPDHLDRYDGSMLAYAQAKMNIAQNQTADDHCFISLDDPYTRKYHDHLDTKARVHKLRYESSRGDIWSMDSGRLYDISGLSLRGRHNRQNALFALSMIDLLAPEPGSIETALSTYTAQEHRLEHFAEVNNIDFYNDSKATNVEAVYYALESMPDQVVWIAGGTDKGNDYAALQDLVKDKVRCLLCLGLDTKKLESSFSDVLSEIRSYKSLDDLMIDLPTIIKSGDSVLLSPACASFDLFDNYIDRGKQFKKAIKEIILQ